MPIVIKKRSGGISIMRLVDGADKERCIQLWKSSNPDQYVSHREIPESEIPIDREFRGAWDDITPEPTVDINMAVAREIHLSRIRKVRNELLSELDKLELIAMRGNSDDLEKIRSRKNELCDLPSVIKPDVEAANSLEQLRKINPL